MTMIVASVAIVLVIGGGAMLLGDASGRGDARRTASPLVRGRGGVAGGFPPAERVERDAQRLDRRERLLPPAPSTSDD